MRIARRTLLGSTLSTAAMPLRAPHDTANPRRRAALSGPVSWEIDVIRHHALDAAAHIAVEPMELATAQAAQVALQAGQVDMIVVDWLWVARQRGTGADWTFVPFSNAVGALIAPANSPVRRHARSGRAIRSASPAVRSTRAGSFCVPTRRSATASISIPKRTRASARHRCSSEQMKAGRLDALLTYWPFAAKAEAAGARRILDVADAVSALGIAPACLTSATRSHSIGRSRTRR